MQLSYPFLHLRRWPRSRLTTASPCHNNRLSATLPSPSFYSTSWNHRPIHPTQTLVLHIGCSERSMEMVDPSTGQIDVVKTRMQLDRTGGYRGIAHCSAAIARTEGDSLERPHAFCNSPHAKVSCPPWIQRHVAVRLHGAPPPARSPRRGITYGFGAGVLEALIIITHSRYTGTIVGITRLNGMNINMLKGLSE